MTGRGIMCPHTTARAKVFRGSDPGKNNKKVNWYVASKVSHLLLGNLAVSLQHQIN